MNIEKLYRYLKQFPDERVCKFGFSDPHPYAGNNKELSLDPTPEVTIKEMINTIHLAINQPFYVDGEAIMYDIHTKVHFSHPGQIVNDTVPTRILLSIAGYDL